MCEPVITGALLAGTAMNAYGQYQAGQFNADMAERQAEIQQMAADDALERGEEAADRQRDQTQDLIGSQRAALGASGVQMDTGSALRLQADSAYLGELDALTIEENARREAMGLSRGAQDRQLEAKFSRNRGTFGAGATLLTGGANAYTTSRRLRSLS